MSPALKSCNLIDHEITLALVTAISPSPNVARAEPLKAFSGLETGIETISAADRAVEIASAMGRTSGWVTIGVTETAEGVRIISSSLVQWSLNAQGAYALANRKADASGAITCLFGRSPTCNAIDKASVSRFRSIEIHPPNYSPFLALS
jgi:hypothetical protein